MGNRSNAGARQSSILRKKLIDTAGQVESAAEFAKRPRTGRGRSNRSRGREGGHRGAPAQFKRERQIHSDSDSDSEKPPAMARAKKPKVETELQRLDEAERQELKELKQMVLDLKKMPQAVAAAPGPPSSEQLTLGGTNGGEAPQTMADRLLLAEVCEHACVLMSCRVYCCDVY